VRLVGLFEKFDLVGRELDVDGRDRIGEVLRLRRADDRGGDTWFRQ
jgi:hypothetical protein